MARSPGRIALVLALLGYAALRIAIVDRTAFNWDEFALFHDVALTAQTGELHSAGHAGLPHAALLPWVRGCVDEIAVGQHARLVWLALVAGVALGVGWLGTQKLAYVAALAGLLAVGDLWLRGEWRTRREVARAVSTTLSGLVVVAAWSGYVSHVFAVPQDHSALTGASTATVRTYLDVFDFYRATIGYSQYVATLPTLGPHLALFAAMIFATIALARGARMPNASGRLALAWAVLALGVVVAAFHAAAFAYFLMTLGLFVAVALALTLPALRGVFTARWPSSARLAAPVVWSCLVLGALLHSGLALDDSQAVQRESLRFVHRNFAADRAGFQPETALFCGARQPIGLWFSQRIYQTFEGPQREDEALRLIARFRSEPVHYLVQSFRLNQFPQPVRVFWDENYQPYRDSVFVAGRRLQGEAGTTTHFDLLVSAPYRWLPIGKAAPIRIDGLAVEPGQVIPLDATRHEASFAADRTRGVLVLALEEPPRQAPLAFYKAY